MGSKQKEYICTYCGKKTIRFESAGRPLPGNCPRRKNSSNTMKPHSWVVNRTIS